MHVRACATRDVAVEGVRACAMWQQKKIGHLGWCTPSLPNGSTLKTYPSPDALEGCVCEPETPQQFPASSDVAAMLRQHAHHPADDEVSRAYARHGQFWV